MKNDEPCRPRSTVGSTRAGTARAAALPSVRRVVRLRPRLVRRWLSLFGLWAATPRLAAAQSIEPRAYSNVPVGVNFLVAGYYRTRKGLSFDTASPLADPNLETDNGLLGYARALDLWGKSGRFDVIVPYTFLSGTATYQGNPVAREVDGFGDPLFRMSVNLYGAPALTLSEFRSYQQDVIVGVSLQVQAPAGQYDDTRLVNVGTNRWTFKPEVGVSKTLGPWTFELQAAVTLFTTNPDFFNGSRRAQDPLVFVPMAWHLQLSLGHLGVARCDVLRRRPHDHRRDAQQRPAAELAGGRDAFLPRGHEELHQALRQQRRVGAYWKQLRSARDRVAVSMGRRALTAMMSEQPRASERPQSGLLPRSASRHGLQAVARFARRTTVRAVRLTVRFAAAGLAAVFACGRTAAVVPAYALRSLRA